MAIRVLPPEIANLIAAGEVVERPASVVKELVENALDAGATDIEVRLEEGGKRLIEVRDDGVGMSREDAILAIERHATSKVRSAEDLAAIQTLGFRGEALPSIAAVSTFSLITRLREGLADAGVQVSVRMPEVMVETVGAPAGTVVRVERLFERIPARQKFLKGERTELAYIQDIVTRLALAAPWCRLRLWHGERELIGCRQRADLRARILELFGAQLDDGLWSVATNGVLSVTGFCGDPALAKAGASQMYLMVNGRPVRDRLLTHAIQEAYRTYIAHGAQPLVILDLALAPELVDVNVHPAKAEVRFVNPGAVHDGVRLAVQQCLSTQRGRLQATVPAAVGPTGAMPFALGEPTGTGYRTEQSALTSLWATEGNPPQPPFDKGGGSWGGQMVATWDGEVDLLRYLGQLARTYLLFEHTSGDLVVIDQHAAHERVGFEALKEGLQRDGIERQQLLQPLVMDLPPLALETMQESQELLEKIGFDVEVFGGQSLAVKGVPALLMDGDIEAVVREVADELIHFERAAAVEQRLDHLLATMACHRQIRAGDPLNDVKALGLVQQLNEGAAKDRCPHGRPTWVRIPRTAIEKWFERR